MDFVAFEQLVLKVLFETHDPLSTPHLAYLARIPVSRAERYLGRMVEQGTVLPRLDGNGQVEYVFAGRRDIPRQRQSARAGHPTAGDRLGLDGPFDGDPRRPHVDGAPRGDDPDDELGAEANSATAVLLSVLVPGAGHIYAGRSGAGVAWMATTLAGYACCLLPGLFLHGLCLVSAAHTRELHQDVH
jgi:hypothetical protein